MSLKRIPLTTLTLITLAVLFVALTMLSNTLLRGLRLDFTEHDLYTLSSGTKNILASIEEPINLYYFFSDRVAEDVPLLRTYANRIEELLQEYVLAAPGKLILHTIDPIPFSEQEDRATQFGLQGVPVRTAGENLYFGLVGTNAVDDVEMIRFFQPDKEAFLEYDISKLIYSLANPKKPVIGLLSTLPMSGGFDPATQQPQPPWIITEQLNQLFEVRNLEQTVTAIAADIDVLMLVHPKELSQQTLYAIDQFILKGGKALVLLDPYAEADTPALDPNNPSASLFADRGSTLEPLLQAWGVEMKGDTILADSRYALPVSAGPNQAPVQHLAVLRMDDSALATDDVIAAELETINLALAGYLVPKQDAETTLEPLITSSQQAMPLPLERVRFTQNPAQLHEGFTPTGERYIVAARLQGKVKSAFPDGLPQAETAAAAEENAAQASDENPDHLDRATAPVNMVVVADTDLLTDPLWVQVQDFFGQRIATAWANNADFIINALDNLTGNNDLIGIRGQAVSARPFTTVDALEREANAEFLATEQQLQQELEETERKLTELQQGRADGDALIFSPEQQQELDRFQQRKLEIRQQLRKVRRGLDQDIERLGTVLKIINIGLMPLLLSVFALTVVWLRRRHRRGGVAA